MVRTKVFVGNLDFKTKEVDLAKAFSDAGKVISANIITRGSRSLGYGFVEMENEEDANKAVSLMHKKELDGRPINVEVAKPREEIAPAQQATSQGEEQATTTGSFQRVGRGTRGRGGLRGRGRGGRGRGRGGRGRGGRSFRPRNPAAATETTTTTATTTSNNNTRVAQPDTRTPSKTTLFVANLPFKLDDEQFTKALKDNSVTFKSAYVVKNQRSGRSKGFGFVEFESEEDQQKGLQALDKKQIDGREVAVKIALTEAQQKEQNGSPVPAAKQ